MPEPDAKFMLADAMVSMTKTDRAQRMDDVLPAIRAFLEEFAAEDFTCVMQGVPPTPAATFPGVEGFDEAWRDYRETFDEVRIELRRGSPLRRARTRRPRHPGLNAILTVWRTTRPS